MVKSVVTYTCDRCDKEIKDSSGTLKYDRDSAEALMLVIKNHFEGNTQHQHYMVDLCEECLYSLNNWFSSDEYRKVESNWDIINDIPRMDYAISLMASRILELENNVDDFDQRQYYLDKADDLILTEKEKS